MKIHRSKSGQFRERPYFDEGEIDRMCADELRKAKLYPKEPSPVRIDRFLEKRFVAPTYPDLPDGLLGFTKFGAKGVVEIAIAKSLDDENSVVAERRIPARWRIEAGHGLAHTAFIAMTNGTCALFAGSANNDSVLCRDVHGHGRRYSGEWWEYQANEAIGGLLLPWDLVAKALQPYLVEVGSLLGHLGPGTSRGGHHGHCGALQRESSRFPHQDRGHVPSRCRRPTDLVTLPIAVYAVLAYTPALWQLKEYTRTRDRATGSPKSPVATVPTRDIKRSVEIRLFVAAGGRCQFPGCSKYLLEHSLTLNAGNFAQKAHIVAFSRKGPRAGAPMPASHINDFGNLMLLCPECHKLIDDHPDEFPVGKLRHSKDDHEVRIRYLTSLLPDKKTTVIRATCKVADRTPEIPFRQITAAVNPLYPADRNGIVVNLSQLAAPGEQLIVPALAEIRDKIKPLHAARLAGEQVNHLSVFALAPIPILVALGRELSDKLEVDFYQRHRDTDDWTWKKNGPDVTFKFQQLRQGSEQDRVALCLSLSGTIHVTTLPSTVDATYSVYEINLQAKRRLRYSCASVRTSAAFRQHYLLALSQIAAKHPSLAQLHLFPAVPAPSRWYVDMPCFRRRIRVYSYTTSTRLAAIPTCTTVT